MCIMHFDHIYPPSRRGHNPEENRSSELSQRHWQLVAPEETGDIYEGRVLQFIFEDRDSH